MKHAFTICLLGICLVLLSADITYAEEYFYLFLMEEGNPIYGYRVLETSKENVFLGKVDAIKKWIILSKSMLYISKDQYLFPVKDSQILDRAHGIVLFLIDLSQKRERNFSLDKVNIDQDIKKIINNKQRFLSKIEEIFPSSLQERTSTSSKAEDINLLALAKNYELTGQIQKAIDIYEELLNKEPISLEISSKIASLYYKSGKFNKAREYLQRLPKNEDNIKKIIGILIIEKKLEDALHMLNKEDLQDKKYLHYTKGIIFYLMNRRDEAYRETIELKKIDSKLAESLGDLLR